MSHSHIDTLYAKLVKLGATSSTNEKLEIVKTFDEDELSTVKLALDPTVNFYIATLPEVEPGRGSWGDEEDALLVELAQREVTGGAALDAVLTTLRQLKPEHADVFRKVLLKDLRVGVGTTLVNKAFPGTVPEFPYMRCSLPEKSNMPKWNEAKWAAGVISDEKADGMFASLTTGDEVVLLSRQGSRFPKDALPALHDVHVPLRSMQLHGELLVYRDGELLERHIGNGILNSLLQGGTLADNETVLYKVWDVVPADQAIPGGKCETACSTRRRILTEIVKDHPSIKVIDYRVVYSKAEAYEHYRSILAAGGEGTIVKDPDGVWKDTTSKDCVKLKLQVDVELRVKGFLPGTGKNADTFGSIVMESACGELVVSVSGFSDADRVRLHTRRETLPGAIFTVRSNLLLKPSPSNDKHSLFLPRAIEERLDKKEADTLEQIRAQFEAAVNA